MTSREGDAYTLCGCFHCATKDEAIALQTIARKLGGGGFSVERVEREGDVETRQVVSK